MGGCPLCTGYTVWGGERGRGRSLTEAKRVVAVGVSRSQAGDQVGAVLTGVVRDDGRQLTTADTHSHTPLVELLEQARTSGDRQEILEQIGSSGTELIHCNGHGPVETYRCELIGQTGTT